MMELVAVVALGALAVWLLRGGKRRAKPTDEQVIEARNHEKRRKAMHVVNEHYEADEHRWSR